MSTEARRILQRFYSTPLAMQESKIREIADFLELRAEGHRFTEEEIQAKVGRRGDGKIAHSSGGVGVLPLFGTIAHRMNLMRSFSGGTSTEKFGAAFDAMMANDDISTIVIRGDTPGGSVYGVPELCRKIREARGKKRIITVVDPLLASAGYYIGSAADEIVVSPSGEVGSIGVFMVHSEYSEWAKKQGIRHTLIRAGRYKAAANSIEPLSDEALQQLQEEVDEYYDLFVEDVALNRGMNVQDVIHGMGQGRCLPARLAVKAGLADRISSFEEVLAELGVSAARLSEARATQAAPLKAASIESTPGVPAPIPVPARSGDLLNAAITPEILKAAQEDALRARTPVVVQAAEPEEPDDEEEDEDETVPANPNSEEEAPSEDPNAAVEPEGEAAMQTQATATQADTQVVVGADALANERKRTSEILQMCHAHGCAEKAEEYVNSGMTADAVGRSILNAKGATLEAAPPAPQAVVDMSPREERGYSIVRAIKAAAKKDWSGAGLELEVSNEAAKKLNREGQEMGFIFPTSLGMPGGHGKQAVLNTGTPAAGGDVVFTQPGSFIELLRSKTVLDRMGASFLTGLSGPVKFPRQTGSGTLSWRAENPGSGTTPSDLSLDQVALEPNDAHSSTSFSRRLMAQANLDVEAMIRNDLAAIAARGVDRAGLHGAGGLEPTGIYGQTGVNTLAMGGALSFTNAVKLETLIVADDADIGTMGYVATPEVRGAGKTTEKASSTGNFIWTGGVQNGEMNGFRAMASNQVKKDLGAGSNEHGIIFGVWDQLMVGEWGALEVIVDPYTLSDQGLIKVTLFLIADIAVRHPEAFAVGTGLTVA